MGIIMLVEGEKDKMCEHSYWKSQSHGALLGYYCADCGLDDWHNEHNEGLRSNWMGWHVTHKFSHRPITFAELLTDEVQEN